MTLPPAPPNVRLVASFAELLATPFQGNVNAICWARTLCGDFAEVVAQLAVHDGLTTIDEALLAALPLGPAGRLAVETLLADLRLLRAAGHEPALDLVAAYPRDTDEDLPTDVLSFHVDSATVPTDTFLCTYRGAPSEGLHHEQARRRTEDPRLRARLLAKFGGPDGPEFRAWLTANSHDLHFTPLNDARPFSFGTGNLWRLAVAWPGSPVHACIHRAPRPQPGDPTRLLLIS